MLEIWHRYILTYMCTYTLHRFHSAVQWGTILSWLCTIWILKPYNPLHCAPRLLQNSKMILKTLGSFCSLCNHLCLIERNKYESQKSIIFQIHIRSNHFEKAYFQIFVQKKPFLLQLLITPILPYFNNARQILSSVTGFHEK